MLQFCRDKVTKQPAGGKLHWNTLHQA